MLYLLKQIERGSNVSNGKGSEGSGLYGVLKRVYIQDGVRGLFRGAGARVLFHTPCTAITMAVFEECKRRWSQVLSLSEI
jgi:Mitochondrial carrier protein